MDAPSTPLKSAADSSADAPDDKKSKPRAQKKRGGFWIFFLWVCLIGGGGYWYYKNIRVQKETAAEPAADTAALRSAIEGNKSRLRVLEQKGAQLEAQLRSEIARLADRPAGGGGRPADAFDHLRLIDLHLRATGDTAAAAAHLRRLIAGAPGVNNDALRTEASRLEKSERRERLLHEINKMKTLLDKPPPVSRALGEDDAAAGIAGEYLRGILWSLYRVERTTAQTATRPHRRRLSEMLRQMEFFLLVGKEAEYRRRLPQAEKLWHNIAADTRDANLESQFNLLLQLRVPDYRLNISWDNF